MQGVRRSCRRSFADSFRRAVGWVAEDFPARARAAVPDSTEPMFAGRDLWSFPFCNARDPEAEDGFTSMAFTAEATSSLSSMTLLGMAAMQKISLKTFS